MVKYGKRDSTIDCCNMILAQIELKFLVV
jgi:hypothetical protein